jgi:threonine/homoserine efflux transporter RhtA
VIGVLAGIAFLGEVPTWRDWLALAMIVTALAIVLLWQARGAASPGFKKQDEMMLPSD